MPVSRIRFQDSRIDFTFGNGKVERLNLKETDHARLDNWIAGYRDALARTDTNRETLLEIGRDMCQ